MQIVSPQAIKLARIETKERRLAKLDLMRKENDPKVELALKYCLIYHAGQFRKGDKEPYYTHPVAVAHMLAKYGYNDTVTQCIALLHDIVEESLLKISHIKETFGYEIANGIFILSRNKGNLTGGKMLSNKHYKVRLQLASDTIKRVKIADMITNTRDLQNLNPRGIRRKIKDAETFYIPMGREVCPKMVKELERNIMKYKRKFNLR